MTTKRVDIKRLAKEINPRDFLDYREYLLQIYKKVKARDGSYTYIKFTEHLGLGACNAMNLIINGKRPLTLKAAKKIAEALGVSSVARRYFLGLVELESINDARKRDDALDFLLDSKSQALPFELDKQQLEFYKYWYNSAILELLGLEEAQDNPEWIIKTLMPRVTPKQVEKCLELLKSLDLIQYDEGRGRLYPTKEMLTTGPEVLGLAIMSFHQQMIQLGKDAIIDVGPEERDISSLTFATSDETRKKVKAYIELFRKKVIQLAARDQEKEMVLQVNFQMFPLTKSKKRKK